MNDRRPEPLARVIARQLPLLAGGFILAALLLLATDSGRPGVRNAGIELRWLLICYPLIALWLLDHLRRRAPERLGPLVVVFLFAFLVRLVALCLITDRIVDVMPSRGGAWNDDSWWYTVVSRFYAQVITGRDYDIQGAMMNAEAISRLMSVEYRGGVPSFLMAWAPLIIANGFGMLAYMLPWTMLGAVWVVQCYVFLRSRTPPLVAQVVLVVMLVLPDFVLPSTMPSKDVLTGILLIYLSELCDDETRLNPLWFMRRALLVFVVLATRYELAPIVLALLGVAAIGHRLAPRYRRFLIVAFAGAVWLVAVSLPRPMEAISNSYTINWLGNLLLVPPLFWLLSFGGWADLALVAVAGQALVWPFVAGLLLVAGVLLVRRHKLLTPGMWLVLYVYHSALATQASMNMSAVRFRLGILPWLLALAGAAALAARREPRVIRHRLAWLGLAVALTLLAFNLSQSWPRLLRG